mmetsp:Transcript_26616/g.74471  ORF Transcript_26616/g.74471 Transcript_26616/m.74471 type:complete len:154 (-) Transcript_26616:739-1200(-)
MQARSKEGDRSQLAFPTRRSIRARAYEHSHSDGKVHGPGTGTAFAQTEQRRRKQPAGNLAPRNANSEHTYQHQKVSRTSPKSSSPLEMVASCLQQILHGPKGNRKGRSMSIISVSLLPDFSRTVMSKACVGPHAHRQSLEYSSVDLAIFFSSA